MIPSCRHVCAPPAQHSGLCQQLDKQHIPLADCFFVVITAATGLTTFHQTLLHHIRGTVKEQHLQGDVATVILSKWQSNCSRAQSSLTFEMSKTVSRQQNAHPGVIQQAAIKQKGMQGQVRTMSQGWICSSKLWAWSSARGKPSMRKLLLPLFSMAFFKSPIVICSIALLVSWTPTIYA